MARNRIRQLSLLGTLVAFLAVTVWANATSPWREDLGYDVVFFLPILVTLVRLATERVVVNPASESVRICNFLHSHRVPMSEIDRFEITEGRWLLTTSSRYVTCVLRTGHHIRVHGAGRLVRSQGPYEVSLTGRKTLVRIAGELNAQR